MNNAKISYKNMSDENHFQFVNTYAQYKKRLDKISFLPDILLKKHIKIDYTKEDITNMRNQFIMTSVINPNAFDDGEKYECNIPLNLLNEILRSRPTNSFTIAINLASRLRVKTISEFNILYTDMLHLFSILHGEYYYPENVDDPKILKGLMRCTLS